MALEREAVIARHAVLAFFDIRIGKLNNLSAMRSDEVIMVITVI